MQRGQTTCAARLGVPWLKQGTPESKKLESDQSYERHVIVRPGHARPLSSPFPPTREKRQTPRLIDQLKSKTKNVTNKQKSVLNVNVNVLVIHILIVYGQVRDGLREMRTALVDCTDENGQVNPFLLIYICGSLPAWSRGRDMYVCVLGRWQRGTLLVTRVVLHVFHVLYVTLCQFCAWVFCWQIEVEPSECTHTHTHHNDAARLISMLSWNEWRILSPKTTSTKRWRQSHHHYDHRHHHRNHLTESLALNRHSNIRPIITLQVTTNVTNTIRPLTWPAKPLTWPAKKIPRSRMRRAFCRCVMRHPACCFANPQMNGVPGQRSRGDCVLFAGERIWCVLGVTV